MLIFKSVLVLMVFIFSARTHAIDLPLLPVKNDVINYCQKEPAPSLIKKCLINLGELFENAQVFIKDNQSLLKQCLIYEKKQNSSNFWVSTINCIVLHGKLQNSFMPFYDKLFFSQKELRAFWLSSCNNSKTTRVSKCLNEKQMAFNRFWQMYTKEALDTKTESKNVEFVFSKCVSSYLKQMNFDAINHCILNKGIN